MTVGLRTTVLLLVGRETVGAGLRGTEDAAGLLLLISLLLSVEKKKAEVCDLVVLVGQIQRVAYIGAIGEKG